jgi:hypothetical protein
LAVTREMPEEWTEVFLPAFLMDTGSILVIYILKCRKYNKARKNKDKLLEKR